MTDEITQAEIDQLQKFNSPWGFIKKALSSIFILLLMVSGLLLNWILGLVYAFGWFVGTGWLWYLAGILLLFIIFPAAYIFSAYLYGQSLLFWEAYREVIRPLVAKMFSKTLDKLLIEQENGKEKSESEIVAELEGRSKHFVEKLPDFIRAYFQVFITSKDVVILIKKQRKAGGEKKAVKNKAMTAMFEALDLQIAELFEPSMIPFYITGAINLIVLYFMF